MRLLDAENRGKTLAVAALVLFGAAAMWNNSQQNAEAALKPCAVCSVKDNDARRKTVFAYVPFNNERFPVDSEEHRAEFLRRPDFYSSELHRLGLHEH